MNNQEYTLQNNGVEMITYPKNLQNVVVDAAQEWKGFCELPEAVKQQYATIDTQSGTGYELKDGSGINGDRKENFDYSSLSSENFTDINDVKVREFVESISRLDGYLEPMIAQFCVDANIQQQKTQTFIRFLHYPSDSQTNDTFAEPHTDHSGFTFHLYETTDGCERLSFEHEWEPLPVISGQAAVFGGMQTQLATGGEVKAMCHRVVANETSSKVGRYAIVCFVAFVDLPKYDKQTQGRLQEKDPGFNYEMPYDEFKELFR